MAPTTTMAPTTNRDAELDAALDAPSRPKNRHFFGQLTLDWENYTLRKGEKRRLWNAQTDGEDEKRLIISFSLHPLSSAPSRSPIKRDVIAQSREFDKFLRPSLAKLGIRLTTLKNAWVQVELVPDGGTYTKRDAATGTTSVEDSTALTIAAIYPDEAACEAAATALFKRNGEQSAPATQPAATAQPMAQDQADESLRTLWKLSNENQDAFLAMLGNLAPFKHLTKDSPEIRRIVDTF